MKAIEIFNSWQGEGPFSGRKMTIFRFKECDRVYHKDPCPYCDTLVKMRISAEADYSIDTIQKYVSNTKGLLVTGGEPTFSNNFDDTFYLIQYLNFDICNVETNGYDLERLISETKNASNIKKGKVKFIFSPKIFNVEDLKINISLTEKIVSCPNLYIKVVDDKRDFVEDYLYEISNLNLRSDQLWIMPEGKNLNDLVVNSEHTMNVCEKFDANFSSRDHILFSYV